LRAVNNDREPISASQEVPARIPGLQLSSRRVRGHRQSWGFAGFHDVVPLSGRRWALAVGGVYGQAIGDCDPAAAQIDIARVVTRAIAQVDFTPSVVLAGMNRALLAGGSAQEQRALAAAYVTVRPSLVGTWARICVAGPQTAFLRRSSGRMVVIGRPGTALGLRADPELSDARLLLRAGDILTLVTASVTESLGGPDRICEILADAGRASAARSTGDIARAIMDIADGPNTRDGVVLAVKVPGTGRDHGLHSAGWLGRGRYPADGWPGQRSARDRAPSGRTRYPF